MSENVTGFSKVKAINENRFSRAEELKDEGREIIGYLCSFVPLELIEAFDMVPFRIYGDMNEPVTEAGSMIPESFCPYVRSILDLVKKGRYDFIDGVVTVHSCDAQEKMAHIWKSFIPYDFFYYIDMPGTTRSWATRMYKEMLHDFKNRCESYTGKKIDTEKLNKNIELYDRQRQLVKDMYGLTKNDPPEITGTEIIEVIKAVQSLPAAEGNQLLEEVLSEAQTSRESSGKIGPRILVLSSTIDDSSIIKVIEDAGANVVIDDNCIGTRTYFHNIGRADEPFGAIAERYLKLSCPRTFNEAPDRGGKKDREADLEIRYSYLKKLIEGWKADGVIISLLRFCDPFGYDLRDLRDYLELNEIPNMYIEHNYTKGGIAPLVTRIEAFLEMLD